MRRLLGNGFGLAGTPLFVALAVSLVAATAAAQSDPGAGAPAGGAAPGGGAPAPAPVDPGAGAPPAGGASTPTMGPPTSVFGVVAPPGAGQALGGGNVGRESASQGMTGDKEDSFDLAPSTGGAATVHGGSNGPIYLGGSGGVSGNTPDFHNVRKGDTLWGICDGYFHNPYQWPRIWSYNPQLQNPHWIYPGDQVRLRQGAVLPPAGAKPPAGNGLAGGSLVDRRRQVPDDTIFLRDTGYVEDEKVESWAEISGAPEDRMFLNDLDEVYLRLLGDHEVKLGQELTIFRPTRAVGRGSIVQIQGTLRIDQIDKAHKIARAQIVESLDVVERGARVGPVGRRFDVVPPKRNDVDLKAEVLASVVPHNFYGQNQLVFLSKGEQDGLKPGNRLFIIRRGDSWRQSLTTDTSAMRIKLESDSPAEIEHMPRSKDEGSYPEEVIAELRILATRQASSTALVTQSAREIELGDVAVARKGY